MVPSVFSAGRLLLDQAYSAFGEGSKDLLDAQADPKEFADRGGTVETWTDLGDWLGVAARLGAEKVLFVRGEPVIVFRDLSIGPDEAELSKLYRRAWCMSEPRCLFVALPTELRVYALDLPPNIDSLPGDPWKVLESVDDVLAFVKEVDTLGPELGGLLETGSAPPTRADQRLIADLRHVRDHLRGTGLSLEQAHALIGRSILVRYLEDRGVLSRSYFERIAEQDPGWGQVLAAEAATPVFGRTGRERYYDRVLQNSDFTHALFSSLAKDFNGDLFALGDARTVRFSEASLHLLRRFLLGEAQSEQEPLFFWAYDFEVVPLSLISSIYEQFYHDSRQVEAERDEADDEDTIEENTEDVLDVGGARATADGATGTHYTSASLVHDALRRTLTLARLALKPKVLDPACGSGIFLVEAFRRIVRFEAHGRRRKLSSDELRTLLRDRIAGIEINAEAARVAAFSLYLALLDQQEPPEILAGPSLPHLVHTGQRSADSYGTILQADAFLPTQSERAMVQDKMDARRRYAGRAQHQRLIALDGTLDLAAERYDVVIGNPPWEEAPEKDGPPRVWAAALSLPTGEWSYSQLFMHRALELLTEGGVAGLLIGAKVLWNRRTTSQQFRRYFLTRTTVKQVVNMTHVRRVFFAGAVAPFMFIEFVNSRPPPGSKVILWNARRTRAVEWQKSVALVPLDRRVFDQADILDADHLWKTYWWGSHRDAALVARLRMEATLQDVIGNVEPAPAYGWQNGPKPASNALASMPQLRSGPLEPFGPLQPSWFGAPPAQTGRHPDVRLYEGQRLIVTRGAKSGFGPYTRLENEKFSFRHTLYCIPLPGIPERSAKLMLGTMWSKLGRYKQFMTSGAWGGWYDQVTSEDVLGTPVRLTPPWGMPGQQYSEATERTVAAVDRLRTLAEPPASAAVSEVLALLDDAVFDLFELSHPERDLVRDFWSEGFDLMEKGSRSRALAEPALPPVAQGTAAELTGQHPQGDLRRYLTAFLETWNPQLPSSAEFVWQVARAPSRTSLAVAFLPVQRGSELPSPAEGRWEVLAERCREALERPVSPAFSVSLVVRGVSRTGFVFVKGNARRLWTASAAREDAEAAFLQLVSDAEEHAR